MMRLSSTATALLLCVSLITGCGDSGRSVNFPVPDDTPVAQLSVSEMQQICQQANTQVMGAYVEMQCTMAGLIAKFSNDGTCSDTRSACFESKQAELQEIDAVCQQIDESALAELQDCDVTVGDYESCINAALGLFDSIVSGMSCSSTIEDLQRLQNIGGPELPAECKALANSCPALDLDDDETIEPMPGG